MLVRLFAFSWLFLVRLVYQFSSPNDRLTWLIIVFYQHRACIWCCTVSTNKNKFTQYNVFLHRSHTKLEKVLIRFSVAMIVLSLEGSVSKLYGCFTFACNGCKQVVLCKFVTSKVWKKAKLKLKYSILRSGFFDFGEVFIAISIFVIKIIGRIISIPTKSSVKFIYTQLV